MLKKSNGYAHTQRATRPQNLNQLFLDTMARNHQIDRSINAD
jgi:hypothetical protein